MKKILTFVLFLSADLLAGCYKYHPVPLWRSIGTFEADLNGKSWNNTYENAFQLVESAIIPPSSAFPCKENRLEVSTELYSTEGYARQILHLMKIPQHPGKNKIVSNSDFRCDEKDPVYAILYIMTQDGDVLGDMYGPAEGFDNYLNIEMYNSKTGEIKGTFQMTMVKTRNGGEPMLPDTLRFTNGRFHTRFVHDYTVGY